VLTDVVDAGADGAPVQIEWGRLHLVAGETQEAAECFEAAIAADPARPAAYFGLLAALHRQGRGEEARRRFAAAVAERPADPAPRTILGILADARGELDAAEDEYRRALAVSPTAAVAANNLAWLLAVKRGQPAEGLPFAESAAKVAAGDPDVLDTFAWILHLCGRSADALPPSERACARRPKEAAFHMRRAEILAHLDRAAAAAEAFETARRLDPRVEAAASARLRMALQNAGR
jgi:Flp pilus assembly protein TadD